MANYKVVDADQLDADMTVVADSIRAKGGTTEKLAWPDGYKAAVDAIQTGFVPVEEKAVNFYDYDATLLYSYTLEEVQALTELPPLPSHEGLVCQGWNWTLEDLKALGRAMDCAPYFITEDGATWFVFDNDTGENVTIPLYWTVPSYAGENYPVIDFGDGSEPYSVASAGDFDVVHDYPPGKYTIKISGCYILGGAGRTFFGGSNTIIKSLLKKIHLGVSVSDSSGLASCNGYFAPESTTLEAVTISKGSTNLKNQAFYKCFNLKLVLYTDGSTVEVSSFVNDCASLQICCFPNGYITLSSKTSCYALKRLALPDTVTSMGNFQSCRAMRELQLPSGLTTISAMTFQYCYSLSTVVIPESVTTIGNMCFYDNVSLRKIRFEGTTPPTVSNSNAFTGIPTDCVVEVLADSLTAYQEATNYASIAAQMVGVESFD